MDSRHLFENLAIAKEDEGAYLERLNSNPVLTITLKEVKGLSYESAIKQAYAEIDKEVIRHKYLLDSDKVDQNYRESLQALYEKRAEKEDYIRAFWLLSQALEQYHGKKTIVLIDEYDVPLQKAWVAEPPYYDEMVPFISKFMGNCLKSNDALEFAVVTGCLRISKESIFTGLNNFGVYSLVDKPFSSYYGITEGELDEALAEYGLEKYKRRIRKWYNGYLFGETTVYNPWSVLNYINRTIEAGDYDCVAFWANTSGNDVVQTLVEKAGARERNDLETLLSGGKITKMIKREVTFADMYKDLDNIWNLLFFTGYLKKADKKPWKADGYIALSIPNDEVMYIYRNFIKEWFNSSLAISNHDDFIKAFFSSDEKAITVELNRALLNSISFMDNAENFYHGFILGMLHGLTNEYQVKSNRETGKGRSDILVYSALNKSFAVILELKVCPTVKHLDKACDEALKQIEDKNYAAELDDLGFTNIHKMGIAFCNKECMVKKA
jgi:hypothetical protein